MSQIRSYSSAVAKSASIEAAGLMVMGMSSALLVTLIGFALASIVGQR